MYNWGNYLSPMSTMGSHRHFSTYKTADDMYSKAQSQNPWHHFAQRVLDIPHSKKFSNRNFINIPTPATGVLYEKCSTFINNSNGYPNNLPKNYLEINCTSNNEPEEPRMPSPVKSAPVDIVAKDPKQVKSTLKSPRKKQYYKKPKSRKNWHKQSLSMQMLIEDIDEVGTDVCNDPNYMTSSSSSYISPNCDTNLTFGALEHNSWKPTLEEYIRKPKPINTISDEIILALPHSPICIKISTPVYFSISPPKPFGHKRIPSDCISEDSFVIFDDSDSSSSEEDDDDDVFDTECSDDESDFIDFKDNSCKNTPKTDVEHNPFKKSNKKVRFADGDKLTEVHHMVAWSYAYQASRKGHWEEYARDRERFKRKIMETCSPEIERILDPVHRQRMYEERFKETTST